MTTLTNNQILGLLYNAVGRAGEVGQEPAFSLQIAGNYSGGVFTEPGNTNSGYSMGLFQYDFGQRGNGQGLLTAYNNWATSVNQSVKI
jgi:hypothetical protein